MRRHWASHRPARGGSHSSPHVVFTRPSPQRSPVSVVQLDEQPSQLTVLPSSHCSVPHTMPSPQPVTSVQLLLQPSQLSVLPSSHSSTASTLPLPQTALFGGRSILLKLPSPLTSFTTGTTAWSDIGSPVCSTDFSR